MLSVTVFAGPSAYGVHTAAQPGAVHWRPPVQRGDVTRLVNETEPGVCVLCDGVFQSAPAVSHAEICQALDAGWSVWGVSSIGAIRAHEMRREGMRGFGWVYDQFAKHKDFTDDELCLLHLPEPPYVPLTEALVNLRYAIVMRADTLGIPLRARRLLLRQLSPLWFGDRSVECVRAILIDQCGVDAGTAQRLLTWLVRHRIKTLDLARLLRETPWSPTTQRARRTR